jgi:streptogramin lyase
MRRKCRSKSVRYHPPMSAKARFFGVLGVFFSICEALSGQTPTPTPGPTTISTVTSWTTENNHAVSGVNLKAQPDGSVWFLVPSNDRIVQLQPDGITFKQWQIRDDKNIGANPVDFEIDGQYVRFLENGESQIDAGFSAVGRLDTTNGALREWVVFGSRPAAFYRAPDGKIWIPQSNGVLQSVDTLSLQVQNYVSAGVFAYSDAVVGPDGAYWLIDFGNNRIVRWQFGADTETAWTMFDPNAGRLNVSQLQFDDGGRLWISELSGNRLDVFDPAANALTTFGGFTNPVHFQLFAGKVYVTEEPGGPGRVAILDPDVAIGSAIVLTPVTNHVGSTANQRNAVVRDTTAIFSTFTSTRASVAATDVTVSLLTPGLLQTQFPSTNAYGIDVVPGGAWVGSEGLLLFVTFQSIGASSDLTVPVAAEFGVSPGERIVTQSTLYNRGSSPITVDALYLYSPGSFAARVTNVIGPGQTLFLPDTFGDSSSNSRVAFGPVRFQVTSGNAGDLLASVRSARILDDGSSYGFAMPALSAGDTLGAGAARTLFTGIRDSEVSIFGVFSPTGADATAVLVAPDGTVRGTRRFQMAANGSQEFNPAASAFGASPEPGDVIRVTVATGSLQPYVNVYDTGDIDVAASLPVAASGNGTLLGVTNARLGQSSYVTDLFLANPDPGRAASVTLSLFPSGLSGAPRLASVSVPAGGTLIVPDVLTGLFSFSGEGAVLYSSDVAISVSARVASRRPEGDYGTFESSLALSDGIPAGGARETVGAPQTATRQTDLLLFNGGDATSVTLVALGDNGAETGRITIPIAAQSAVRVSAPVGNLGGNGPAGRLRVEAPAGSQVTAAAEQIDLGTGDLEIAPLR